MNSESKYEPQLLMGLIWAFSVTVLRAFRWPNDWAEAHWMITYEFGFLKRALAGTLLDWCAKIAKIENFEILIKAVSTSLFLTFCAVLFWVCIRIIRKSELDLRCILAVLVFLTSPFIVMSAHLNGYFDNIIILISIFASRLVIHERTLAASILLSVGVLIHETTFLIGLPLVILATLMRYAAGQKIRKSTRLFGGFIARYKFLIILPLSTFIFIVVYQTMFLDMTAIKTQLVSHLSRLDFIQQNRSVLVPKEFTASFFSYLERQSPWFFYRITEPKNLIHITPPLMILIYVWHTLKPQSLNRFLFFTFLAVTLLPLSLHVIAWDISRIWTYPLAVATLAVWLLIEIFPAQTKQNVTLPFLLLGLMVVVFQLSISTQLMDGARERFSIEKRMILYAPSLILFALFCSKHYRLRGLNG